MASPCIDVCHHDDRTGWCLGCGMTRAEKRLWRREKPLRPAIRAALPDRLAALSRAGRPTGKAAKRAKARDGTGRPD